MYGTNDTTATCPFCRTEHDITPSDVSNRFTTTCNCGVKLLVNRNQALVVGSEDKFPGGSLDVTVTTDFTIESTNFESPEDAVEFVREQLVAHPAMLDIRINNSDAINATYGPDESPVETIDTETIERVLDEHTFLKELVEHPAHDTGPVLRVLAGHLAYETPDPVTFETAYEHLKDYIDNNE